MAMAEAGAKVGRRARNEEKLSALVKDIARRGGTALVLKMDVADADTVKAGFKQGNREVWRLDILVNNATHHARRSAMRHEADDWGRRDFERI